MTPNQSVSSMFSLSPSSCWEEVPVWELPPRDAISSHHTLQDPPVLMISQDLLEVLPKSLLLSVDLMFSISIGNGE